MHGDGEQRLVAVDLGAGLRPHRDLDALGRRDDAVLVDGGRDDAVDVEQLVAPQRVARLQARELDDLAR